MAEALVSPLVEQLLSITARDLEQRVRLVVGVETELKNLISNLTAIRAVLADAEKKQVRYATVRDWLEKLKHVAYDIEDVLDDWEAAIRGSQSKHERKVCSFLRSSCFYCKQVGLRHDIAREIKELNERLEGIANERASFQFVETGGNSPIEPSETTSMVDVTGVYGREEDNGKLVERLLSEPSDGDGSDLRVLSIVGMGGLGKTTLAQIAFNNDEVNDNFDKKIWVCVSDPFNETRVAKIILDSLSNSNPPLTGLDNLLGRIRVSAEGKKILLIMDDVWEEDSTKWDRLNQSLRSASKIRVLVTTRNRNVAVNMGCVADDDIFELEKLADQKCWSIISKIALLNESDQSVEEVFSEEVSKKCKGLPLAAKALGGILRGKKTKEEWQSILRSDLWELGEREQKVVAPLWLSYNDLYPKLRRCFSYCTIFPKNYLIKKSDLIKLWMAQGYLSADQRRSQIEHRQGDNMEDRGEIYFQNLAMRCFFQDFEYDDRQRISACKMHDMIHDLVQIVAGDECHSVQVNGPIESIFGSLPSKVRHLSLDCSNSTPSFKSFDGTKKLRSLLIWGSRGNWLSLTTEDLSRLFSESTRVRSLSLRYGDFAEIPTSIRKLVRLRWLDLSGNRQLTQLPDNLCELHRLETLDISQCYLLEQLPHGIGKLINLRHLHNLGGPCRLPKGIAELTGLRTLEEVHVGCDDDAFSLGDLKNLNQLRGSLQIRGLGARDRHVDEANQAKLNQKMDITRLDLWFSGRGEERCTPRDEELLLEALEPSPNLEKLKIDGYRGTTFPGWMISLMNLRSINLSNCGLCEHLPSLGKLLSLETLELYGMLRVKKVGVELLGIETQIGESKSEISSSSSSPVNVAFPKLTALRLDYMPNWEEWDDYYDDTASIMSSLCSLTILNCSRLRRLPNYILQNREQLTRQIYGCTFSERTLQ